MKPTRLPAGATAPYEVWVKKEPRRHWTVSARNQVDAKRKVLAWGDEFNMRDLDAVRKETE